MEAAESLGFQFRALYEAANGGKGELEFDYLVDASGRAGLMRTESVRSHRRAAYSRLMADVCLAM